MQCERSFARSLAGIILLARSLMQKRASECSVDDALYARARLFMKMHKTYTQESHESFISLEVLLHYNRLEFRILVKQRGLGQRVSKWLPRHQMKCQLILELFNHSTISPLCFIQLTRQIYKKIALFFI